MLMPRKVKHRKQRRPYQGCLQGGTNVTHGQYGIQALEPGWITARQIEAARIAMTRHQAWRQGVDQRLPDKPVTQKLAETRMGSGKGQPGALGRRRAPRTGALRAQLPRRRHRPRCAGTGPSRSCRVKAKIITARGDLMAKDTQRRLPWATSSDRAPRRGEGTASSKLRFQLATGQPREQARIGQTKDIARINTELRAREIAAAEAAIERGVASDDTATTAQSATPARCAMGIVTSNEDGAHRHRHRDRACPSPRYNKTMQQDKKPGVHDETNDLNVGDRAASWRPGRCPS